MVLDPLTVLTRPLQELLRPYMGTDAVGLATGALVSRGAVSSVAVLSLVPLGALLALNAVSRRFWCTALCPLGGLLAVISHAPGFRRVVDRDSCRSCGSCAKRCPMGAIRPDKDFSSETGECIACGTCIDECRFGALGFHVTLPGRGAFAHDPDRRSAVLAAGTAAAGLVVVATPVLRPRPDIPDPVLDGPILRPPSTDDARLAQLCVRCGACYGACPTGALHPSLSLSNPAGPWTPMLDVRPLHCTLNCNRCAGVCPTDALHTPTAEEAVALGLGVVASIDTRRCRAWARNKTCLLCVGVCPISGALTAVDRPPGLPTFRRVPVQVPRVDRDLCVGCNVCSGACPVQPPAIATNLQRVPVPSGPTIPQMMGVEPLDD
jgi:ferredoxin